MKNYAKGYDTRNPSRKMVRCVKIKENAYRLLLPSVNPSDKYSKY